MAGCVLCLFALLLAALVRFGQWQLAIALATIAAGSAVWSLLVEPRLVAPMPDCEACGLSGRKFTYVGFNQHLSAGVFGVPRAGFFVMNLRGVIAVEVSVPNEKGSVHRCTCRHWFRSDDFRSAWVLADGTRTLHARRRWGRWSRERL